MNGYTYVYVLQSELDAERHYTGMTDDLGDRVRRHNAGECEHTTKFRPWKVRVAVASAERALAAEFERYLKTHSGRVFASRHF